MSNKTLHPLTATINQKQKNKSKQARQEALKWLAATFPKAFDTTIAIHPLKIGIMKDLLHYVKQDPSCSISFSKLREAVVIFTRSIEYLTCIKAREIRIDLDGNPTVFVTEDEAAQAAAKIRKQIEKNTLYHRKSSAIIPTPSSEKLISPQPLNAGPLLDDENVYLSKLPTRVNTVVKHRVSKKYDIDTVTRLKEKLGLTSKPV